MSEKHSAYPGKQPDEREHPLALVSSAPYEYIDSETALKNLTLKIEKSKRISVDTEADSLHHYFEKVCLIQLTINKTHYIVDPLSKIDLTDFLNILSEKPLILHGADYDLRMLQSSFCFSPKNRIFDTMIAARLLGYEKFSLAGLVEHFFNISLKKQGQKSNWAKRPLSISQLEYASNDTKYLETIADNLLLELKSRNRYHWFTETVDVMVKSTETSRERDPDEAWRIKGTGLLAEHQLIYLKKIWSWREKLAAKRDIPTFKILGNRQMIGLSAWAAENPSCRAQDFPGLTANYPENVLRSLEKSIEKAGNTSSTDWPGFRKKAKTVHKTYGYKKLVKALKEECLLLSEELGLKPSDIANNASLESIACEKPKTLTEVSRCGNIMKWQAKLLYPIIRKIIK